MKKWLIPACIVGVLLMGSVVVLQNKTQKANLNWKFNFEQSWGNNAEIHPSGKTITIPLNQGITQLHNETNANLRQFCGTDLPNIQIDANLLAELDQEQLKQGIISSKSTIQLNSQMPDITFNTGKPISDVRNQGIGNLMLNCPDHEHFTLRNLGTGNVTVGDSYIKAVNIQNMGTGNILFSIHKITNATIDTRGTGSVNFKNVETASVNLYGTGNVTFANAPKITSTVKGLGSIKTNVTPSAERSPY